MMRGYFCWLWLENVWANEIKRADRNVCARWQYNERKPCLEGYSFSAEADIYLLYN